MPDGQPTDIGGPNPDVELPEEFPFRDKFLEFLGRWRRAGRILQAPTGRKVSPENIPALRHIVHLLVDEEEGWSERDWNRDTQGDLLDRLIEDGTVDPTADEEAATDPTALPRMLVAVLKRLGLVRVEGGHLVATDAGVAFVDSDDEGALRLLSRQAVKVQHPSPDTPADYRDEFEGILPHLFLMQVLDKINRRLTRDEHLLFVNIAKSQDELSYVAGLIDLYRQLSEDQQADLITTARVVNGSRYTKANNNFIYQMGFYTLPPYLHYDDNAKLVIVTDEEWFNEILDHVADDLVVPTFETEADWIAYIGDPDQGPDWWTWINREIERAESAEEAQRIVEENRERVEALPDDRRAQVQRKQVEKSIEDFYEEHPQVIEEGLAVYVDDEGRNGRQYPTDVGPVDLLCVDENGTLVIVEIKVDEAEDGVFGQILRYMGWLHAQHPGARDNVRGIILAGSFPDSAKYSRIGLGIGRGDDVNRFLQFETHGFKTKLT